MRRSFKKKKTMGGFSLVEITIGVVLSCVAVTGIVKGRELYRSMMIREFSQNFIQSWVSIGTMYFDRVGEQLCDGAGNGGDEGFVDGRMDNVWLDAGESGKQNRRRLMAVMSKAGIPVCDIVEGNGEDSESLCGESDIFEHSSMTDASQSRIPVGFFFSQAAGERNVVAFRDVPLDVAVDLDRMIDGIADGETGACLNFVADGKAVDPWNAENVGVWQHNAENTAVVGIVLDF
jgi:hypothetical protein